MKLQQFLSNEENVTKSKDHLVASNNKLNMVESLLDLLTLFKTFAKIQKLIK